MTLNYKSPYFKLLIFFGAVVWLNTFTKSIIPPYLLKWGLSLDQILLGTGLVFAGQFFMLIVIAKTADKFLSAHLSWILSFITFAIYILLIIRLESVYQFYVATFFSGFATVLFFVYYNTAHFKNTAKDKIGRSSAVMFSVSPIISMLAPLVAGFLANYKYNLAWIFSGIFFLIPFFLIRLQKNFSINCSLKNSFEEVSSTRIFIFIEGIWESLVFGIIPVYTLFFLKTPLNYTAFIAYLALISTLANILLGKFSDKIKKRVVFLYPITLLLAGITFLFPLATENLMSWIIITSLVQFLLPLFWNISTAMVVDSHKDLGLAMLGRETPLISGRALGIAVTFLGFTLEKTPLYIFFFLGSVMIFYPMILFWRTRLRKHYSYI